eukprot:9473996-Pyramimonas_sp.AAC.2
MSFCRENESAGSAGEKPTCTSQMAGSRVRGGFAGTFGSAPLPSSTSNTSRFVIKPPNLSSLRAQDAAPSQNKTVPQVSQRAFANPTCTYIHIIYPR